MLHVRRVPVRVLTANDPIHEEVASSAVCFEIPNDDEAVGEEEVECVFEISHQRVSLKEYATCAYYTSA